VLQKKKKTRIMGYEWWGKEKKDDDALSPLEVSPDKRSREAASRLAACKWSGEFMITALDIAVIVLTLNRRICLK
jgi:hypothetical protein